MAKNWPHYALNQVAWPTSIVATPIDCAHHLICSTLNLLLMHTTGLLFVGKGRQQHKCVQSYMMLQLAQTGKVCTGYVLLEL